MPIYMEGLGGAEEGIIAITRTGIQHCQCLLSTLVYSLKECPDDIQKARRNIFWTSVWNLDKPNRESVKGREYVFLYPFPIADHLRRSQVAQGW
jgi:hypothetical protein